MSRYEETAYVAEIAMTDQELKSIIAEAGLKTSVAKLRRDLARIDAAAVPVESPDWIALIAPGAAPELADRLRAARVDLRRQSAPWSAERMTRLRRALSDKKLDGFILPLADEHLGEFMPDAARRLSWLTGFSGSSGSMIIHKDKAAFFVDGRYVLQANRELDGGTFEIRHFRKPPPLEWLAGEVAKGERIGYDPRITSIRSADQIAAKLKEAGAVAVALEANPVDAIWKDRPARPLAAVESHPLEYAGVSADEKIEALGAELKSKGYGAVVLNQLDSIAWLLNVRGHDVAHTPVVQSYAILYDAGQAEFFVDKRKTTLPLATHLGNRTAVRDETEFAAALKQLGARKATVALDFDRTNAWIRDQLLAAGATVKAASDPTSLPRARKNSVEIAGIRAAHERDGVAVTKFLKWVAETALERKLTELDAVGELTRLRALDPKFRGSSFDTIAGAGPNGAIVHYRPMPETNRVIEANNLLLIDSGGQYLDGTTDITRTIAVGKPTPQMQRHFTLVLKAHIAVATARFPKGATGGQIDALARQHVWRDGVDYDHGTGHGVGAYLGVHEGPQRLAVGDTTKLEAGMVVSNEPGLYFTDRYGIRTENLVHIHESEKFTDYLEFETLTLAPIDRSLVVLDLLEKHEIEWLDAYHARVRDVVGAAFEGDDAEWLKRMTLPIQKWMMSPKI